jgi:hypothetical protein
MAVSTKMAATLDQSHITVMVRKRRPSRRPQKNPSPKVLQTRQGLCALQFKVSIDQPRGGLKTHKPSSNNMPFLTNVRISIQQRHRKMIKADKGIPALLVPQGAERWAESLKLLAGHSSLAVTQRYIQGDSRAQRRIVDM